ncbi:hypothetical protein GLP02_24635, partial [Escherichia coli]|nr:hypothetical protein [Escherichia coli]
HQGYDHRAVALTAGAQRTGRSDLACSAATFSSATESGMDTVVVTTAASSLGQTNVQGEGNPTEV